MNRIEIATHSKNKIAALVTFLYIIIIICFWAGIFNGGTIAMPNLEREYAVPSDIPSDYVGIVDRQIKERIAEIEKDATNIVSWIALAALRQSIRDYDGAEEILLYVIQENPNGLIAYSNLGNLYASYKKDLKKADKAFTRVIELDPSYIAGYRSLYELYRSGYRQESGAASAVLERGLESNHENIELLMMLGAHALEQKNILGAKAYFERALTQAKKSDEQEITTFIETQIQKLTP